MAKRTMMIEVEASDFEEAKEEYVISLEKKVKSLASKLKRRDNTIQALQEGVDLSKEKRAEIKSLASDLVSILSWSGWTDYDEFC
jgi:exonuclease VII small subunit